MAKVLGVKTLLQKKFTYLDPLPAAIRESFGNLVANFIMIVWGMSGNGKSNFLMQFLKVLITFGKVLYLSLEEGTEATIVATIQRHLSDDPNQDKVQFADHEMSYERLMVYLAKKKSPKFIIIDSLQYWNISYDQYKAMKERFPRKSFIFISHAEGKNPKGGTATSIRYDAAIKVHVEGYVAKVVSRYGGNKPFVIWPEGARKYWGKQFSSVISGVKDSREKSKKKPASKSADASQEQPATEAA